MYKCHREHDPLRRLDIRCCRPLRPDQQPKLLAVLSFSRDELVYDVANIYYVEGHIIPGEEGQTRHIRHTTQDVAQQGNIDRVTRQLDLRVAEVTEVLYPYTQTDIPICEEHTPGDEHPESHPWRDDLKETQLYTINLKLPADYSETTVKLLEYLVHEYLVARCVEDWLMITVPDKGRLWTEKADKLLLQINDTRSRPHMRAARRRPLHPF